MILFGRGESEKANETEKVRKVQIVVRSLSSQFLRAELLIALQTPSVVGASRHVSVEGEQKNCLCYKTRSKEAKFTSKRVRLAPIESVERAKLNPII